MRGNGSGLSLSLAHYDINSPAAAQRAGLFETGTWRSWHSRRKRLTGQRQLFASTMTRKALAQEKKEIILAAMKRVKKICKVIFNT